MAYSVAMTLRRLQCFAILLVPLNCTDLSSQDRPNVLSISIDDLNDWIGCLDAHPQALTPNIDRLAKRGVLFTNAHCVAPACNPSRAALFSGQYPTRTGIWSNKSPRLLKKWPDKVLIQNAFAKAGYDTLGTGKLLHGGAGLRASFQDHFVTEQRWSPLTRKGVRYTPEELPSKGTDEPRHVAKDARGREIVLPLNRMPSDRKPNGNDGESFDWGPFDVPESDMGDTKITDWAIEKLGEKREKPFFLGVGYYRPHIPLWAPKKYFDRFRESPGVLPTVDPNDLDDLSEVAQRWAIEAVTAGSHATVIRFGEWRAAVEAYLACVTYVDHQIGRLLDALDASAAGKNTLILLWSDHGWHLGEKEHWGKWTGWERSTRVPLIIVPPKSLAKEFAAPGSRCDEPVSLIDLYPTLVDFGSLDAPVDLDGRSLVPLLENPQHETGRNVLTFFDPGNTSVRDRRYRFIRYADGSEELYDHLTDAHEHDNLVGRSGYAKIRERLAAGIPKTVQEN